jgi:hypothetical protein
MEKLTINQKDNYNKNFGISFRSSTIFYFKKDKNFKTFVNFMDYWTIKKSIKVMLIASLRDMSGKLIQRERLNFENGNVINYSPVIDLDSFEGSLEIEALANDILGIPFAAILGIYESENSVSMVHGYTRNYSVYEIEDGKTIEKGEEAGLVCRDNDEVRSFLIGHNGISKKEKQEVSMWLSNNEGETIKTSFELKELNPYETFKIYPRNHFPDLIGFLNGEAGNCAISYSLKGGFTRMVVGNETIKGDEFQVMHSNFNYNRHNPGFVDDAVGFFSYPYTKYHEKQITHIDPFCSEGKYEITNDDRMCIFESSHRKDIEMKSEVLKVKRMDGKMPARLNIILSAFLKGAKCKLPMESARGFYHKNRPPKHRLWMAISLGKKYRSKIILHSIKDIYGEVGNIEFEVLLYRESTFDVISKKFSAKNLKDFEEGVYADEIFPEMANEKENEIAQLWLQSSYGGFQAFTTLEAKNGSASIEHNY